MRQDSGVPDESHQKASIEGRVTTLAGDPLSKAVLRLRSVVMFSAETGRQAGQAHFYDGETDAQGNFVFEEVESGQYTLSAERTGYVRSGYPSLIKLDAGKRMTSVWLKLTPQAVISGRITDEDGDPFPNAHVSVLARTYSNGRKLLQVAGDAVAGPDGGFAIGNLSPGRYYVSADAQTPRTSVAPVQPGRSGPEAAYLRTFYPGATEASTAVIVQVIAGEDMRGIDIRMRKSPVFRIRGKILDTANGTAPARIPLSITPVDSIPIVETRQTIPVASDGVFEFDHLAPGVYVIQALAGAPGTGLLGREVVTVGQENVDGVVLRVGPPAEIMVKLTTEGESQQQSTGPTSQLRIQLMPMERTFQNPTQTNENGTIHVRGVPPMMHQINFTGLPQGTYVKSVRFENAEVTGTLLDLTSGAGGTLSVLLSPNAADLKGAVRLADGTMAAGAVVILWTPGGVPNGTVDSARTARTDANGGFQFTNLSPGEYRLAAWDVAYAGLAADPEFRIQFDDKVTVLKLGENSHESIESVLIANQAAEAAIAKMR